MKNLFNKVKGAASNVAKGSGELVEVLKLKNQIRSQKSKIEDIYLSIGKDVYSRFQTGECFTGLDAHFSDIESCEKRIAELQTTIDEINSDNNNDNQQAEA